ncbi:DUF6173 family protein [Bacillaceae bacterium IKA-2]|nr:DUF6173 family protein [Bacillaceae bacterium IKA-2]
MEFPQIKVVTPNLNCPDIIIPTNPNLASESFEGLVKMINEFDQKLDEHHEVGMRLVSFGKSIQFHVEDLGYYNPSLIIFYGRTEDGQPLELIQHVSQISFLLMAVKRLSPEEPKKRIEKRIGFNVEKDKEEEHPKP